MDVNAKTHLAHTVSGAVGGLIAAGAALGLIATTKPSLVAPSPAVAAAWAIDAVSTADALRANHVTELEVICGNAACQSAADQLVAAAEKDGISADAHAPIGRVPNGLTVLSKSPDPGKLATAINTETGGKPTIRPMVWPFYKPGYVTIAFGRIK